MPWAPEQSSCTSRGPVCLVQSRQGVWVGAEAQEVRVGQVVWGLVAPEHTLAFKLVAGPAIAELD